MLLCLTLRKFRWWFFRFRVQDLGLKVNVGMSHLEKVKVAVPLNAGDL